MLNFVFNEGGFGFGFGFVLKLEFSLFFVFLVLGLVDGDDLEWIGEFPDR